VFNIAKLFRLENRVKPRVHFVGVCGVAMSAVAAELERLGAHVTGSDRAAYPPASEVLARAGVRVFEGFHAEHLDPAPDLVVVGNAVSRGNPEVERVLEQGLAYISLAELVGRLFLDGREPVVVAGTHGKTTTTALCAWCLRRAGRDPGWLVGGLPLGTGKGFHVGDGPTFVLEGDEYDTAFFDKRPKFVHYRPRVAVLNNLEYDHADVYRDLEALRWAFRQLLRIVPRSGLVVANADDPEVRGMAREAPCPVWTYSLKGEPADWTGAWKAGRVSVQGPGGVAFSADTNLVGSHQGWNVLAAAAVLSHLGLAPEEIAEGIASFPGVRRRAELVGEAGGVRVYDDFAHHPTAVRGTLEGFRERFPDARIWAVLEPRSNTMRRAVFQEVLASAFDAADRVCIRRPVEPEKAPAGDRLDVERLARDVSARGTPAAAFPNADAIVACLADELRPGDVVVVMSNGGFEGIHGRLLEALAGVRGRSGRG